MVQSKSRFVIRPSASNRPKGTAITKRKTKPNHTKKSNKATAAINRRIESLMAGRLAHEGGTLSILHKPNNAEKFDNSRIKLSKSDAEKLKNSTKARLKRQRNELPNQSKNTNDQSNKKRKIVKPMNKIDPDEIKPRDDVIFSPDSDFDENEERLNSTNKYEQKASSYYNRLESKVSGEKIQMPDSQQLNPFTNSINQSNLSKPERNSEFSDNDEESLSSDLGID